ncbi:electron transfer flavoprotein subunit alpha/FixB family protein [Paradesulfitobacterium aromaticivorans]
MIRPSYGDRVYTTLTCLTSPKIVTIIPGAIGVDKPKKNRKAEVIPVEVNISSEEIRTKVVGLIKADPLTVDLKEADIVVVGGRGVGGPQQWSIIEELASVVGGSVGATRLALDQGCAPEERLVGVTGRTTNPQLYIGAGVSGASQHVSGMSNAKLIIAINKDKGAPILKLADLGIVGDLHQVIPALIKGIRERKASAEGGGKE